MTSRGAALVSMHLATLLFGVSGVFGRLTACSAEMIVFGRTVFALGLLWLLLLCRGVRPWQGVDRRQAAALAVSAILLALHWFTFFLGIKTGGVAVGTLGFACFPAFVAVFEHLFFHERITRSEKWLMLAVTCGLVLVAPSYDFGNSGTEGLLWGIVSGAIYALNAVSNRRNVGSMSGEQACWWQYAVIAPLTLPLVARELPTVSGMDWLWLACLGLLCSGLAYTLFVNSLRAIPARLAAIVIALEPLYAILVSWVLLDEAPGLRTLAGGVLILGAVVAAGLRRQPA